MEIVFVTQIPDRQANSQTGTRLLINYPCRAVVVDRRAGTTVMAKIYGGWWLKVDSFAASFASKSASEAKMHPLLHPCEIEINFPRIFLADFFGSS